MATCIRRRLWRGVAFIALFSGTTLLVAIFLRAAAGELPWGFFVPALLAMPALFDSWWSSVKAGW
jgi:hypothetical protein